LTKPHPFWADKQPLINFLDDVQAAAKKHGIPACVVIAFPQKADQKIHLASCGNPSAVNVVVQRLGNRLHELLDEVFGGGAGPAP
jgi:hypothetical protein